jgi:transposase
VIYVRQPTDEERQELKRMTRQAVGRVSQRAQMILLSAQRRTVPEIARIFEMSEATVRFWIDRFNAEGPDGLYDEPRSGRPPKVTKQVNETIEQLIQDDPSQEGYLATFWTVAMMVLALATELGVRLSASAVRGAFHQLDLRWGRPRLAMPRKVDPDKAQKQWLIAQTVIEAGSEAVILYGDESRVQLLPLIRACWHWVGQQIRVPTPGTNQPRALFGALNIRTGRWVYLVRERMFKEDFIAFLEHLLVEYPGVPIVLIVDNFSSHTAGAVQAWLAEHRRLRLLYLPKYCSHLNPVEPIWLRLKDKIAANRLYGSMAMLLDAVKSFFDEMTPEKALTWSAA